jgi:hypothetical protein
MKLTSLFFFAIVLTLFSFSNRQGGNVEFVCMKAHKATNTCHFNFTVDGAKYRYLDKGCKYTRKTDELVNKVKEGSLALAKDWKIECPPTQ